MPSKRRKITRGVRTRITAEVLESYKNGDVLTLHRLLGLKPWQASPIPYEVHALGVDQDTPPAWLDAHGRSDWEDAQALQREIEAVIAEQGRRDQ